MKGTFFGPSWQWGWAEGKMIDLDKSEYREKKDDGVAGPKKHERPEDQGSSGLLGKSEG